ncbi:hypothetical protein ACFQQB_30510 [Nonomuraea rubra]|uniref:hypothetical protein n=1 Tax=Nonomuraea rubra TaxID=46180 RepID=UPI003617B76E
MACGSEMGAGQAGMPAAAAVNAGGGSHGGAPGTTGSAGHRPRSWPGSCSCWSQGRMSWMRPGRVWSSSACHGWSDSGVPKG